MTRSAVEPGFTVNCSSPSTKSTCASGLDSKYQAGVAYEEGLLEIGARRWIETKSVRLSTLPLIRFRLAGNAATRCDVCRHFKGVAVVAAPGFNSRRHRRDLQRSVSLAPEFPSARLHHPNATPTHDVGILSVSSHMRDSVEVPHHRWHPAWRQVEMNSAGCAHHPAMVSPLRRSHFTERHRGRQEVGTTPPLT
jgi:hypothetical protein